MRVVVAGAGFAGLLAADRVAQAGHEVVVLAATTHLAAARCAEFVAAGLAHNAKLHMPLTQPAAASAVQSVPERFWTWTATDRTGQVQPVLHAFGGTEEGLAGLGVAVADGDDELIAAPLGRVHFAGEHTAGAWAGLMEGALRTGARAAEEILAHAIP